MVADLIQFLDRPRDQEQLPSDAVTEAVPDGGDIPTFTE